MSEGFTCFPFMFTGLGIVSQQCLLSMSSQEKSGPLPITPKDPIANDVKTQAMGAVRLPHPSVPAFESERYV